MIQVLYINVDINSMIINQPNAVYWDTTAQLEAEIRELEAELERLAERLNRLERAQ
jgi:ubiquinone biosynthesis protein UbiJ